MTVYEALTLFLATYANVFFLGFQSKNVNQSKYMLAAMTSVCIGIGNYIFIKFAIDTHSLLFITISGAGGSLGIVSAIWVHDNICKIKQWRSYTTTKTP